MLIKNFFISFLMFFSFTVYAENIWKVKDIQFQGLKNFSQNEILKNIFFSMGNTISEHDIKNSIKFLFKTGNFEDIKVIYSGPKIIFKVQERPLISNVFISGNNLIKNVILEKYLNKLNIQKGTVLNPSSINIFTKTIEHFYHNLGRYKSKVKILKFYSPDNYVNLKIFIDEGVITKINSIKIFGNKDFSQEKIASLLKLNGYNVWWNFFNKNTYSPVELRNNLDRLSSFYLNQGYFYFDINQKQVKFLKEKKYVDISISIFEGNQYNISHFFINGNVFPYKDSIKKIININHNELYNKDKINYIIKKIKQLLWEYGYINSEVIIDPQIDYEKKTIILNFNIDIKKRYFVKRIYFTGNESTRDEVLRREIPQQEGKYFNAKLVESGKESLEKTKYFSEVKIINKIDSHHSNQVNIIYKVKETSMGSINFGLGYGIDSGISFNTSFSQKNIFGSGNSLKASAIKNDNQKYTDISINYPYFITKYTDLNTRFFYNDLKYNLNNISNLRKNTYGFESNLSFLINHTNRLNFGLGYTHNGIINTEKKELVSSLLQKSFRNDFLKDSVVENFTINYSWIYDSLKYFYFPFSGNQTYLSGKNTIPGSDNHFYKIMLDSEEYIPLNKKQNFIFFSHIHMGLGNGFNREKLPFYENFYANNTNKIRGFRLNTIGPKKIYDNFDLKNCLGHEHSKSCESLDSIGGNAIMFTNLELITPIPFINNQYTKLLRPSVFIDAGNIWDAQWNNTNSINPLKFLKNNSLNDIYASYGVSLQWFSPIGPLVFSYSFPMQKNKNQQLEPFQFSFGKNW